jgi:hypothetical protein
MEIGVTQFDVTLIAMDRADSVAAPRLLDLRAAAPVVDDDRLLQALLSGERVQAAAESFPSPVGDDDRGDPGQYAPRAATTAGTVLARMEMSSQIDQFSR